MPNFDSLYITIDPMIKGSLFITRGPKRDYRLYRLHNGVSILIEPHELVSFGIHVMGDKITEAVIRLPRIGSAFFFEE